MRARYLLFFVFACLVSGCSMIRTQHLDDVQDEVAEGTAYSLPMTMVEIAIIQYSTSLTYDVAGFKLNSSGACAEADSICSEVQLRSDPLHSYLVNFRGNVFYNDTLEIGVDAAGFLTKANGIAKDETLGVLLLATRLGFGDVPQPKAYADKRGTAVLVDRILFDPHNSSALSDVNDRLREYSLSIECTGACGPAARPVHAPSDVLYYRLPRTIFLEVRDLRSRKLRRTHPIASPNGSPLIAHYLDRSPFIERKTEITYVAGVPSAIKHSKPSEALGLVTGIGQIAGAVIFSPFNAITGETQNLNTQKANLLAREQLLEQQQKTLQAEADYRAQYGSLPYVDPRLIQNGNQKPNSEEATGAGH